MPWSGRISGGGFWFGGQFHALAPNLPGEPLPLHGNAFTAVWEVEWVKPARACLQLRSDGPGPYRYHARVIYRLQAGALTVTLSVTNRAGMALPYGLGLHPWFPRTPGTTLRFAARTVWLEDARHLPARSAQVVARPDWDFSEARTLPQGWLHGWFSGWDGTATVAWPERGLSLDVAAEARFNCCVLYSPSGESGFFCFEPVSHLVDAHNLPGGVEAYGLVALGEGDATEVRARFSPRDGYRWKPLLS